MKCVVCVDHKISMALLFILFFSLGASGLLILLMLENLMQNLISICRKVHTFCAGQNIDDTQCLWKFDANIHNPLVGNSMHFTAKYSRRHGDANTFIYNVCKSAFVKYVANFTGLPKPLHF